MESLNAALMKNVKNSEGNFGGYIANIFKEGKNYLVHVLLNIIYVWYALTSVLCKISEIEYVIESCF